MENSPARRNSLQPWSPNNPAFIQTSTTAKLKTILTIDPNTALIHPLSVVGKNVTLGRNVILEPFCTIHDDVVIGDECRIGSHAVIYPGARIGNRCQIFPGAVISSIPQDKKFEGEPSLAVLGNDVTVREHATITRGTRISGKTIIGDRTLIMAKAHVAHDVIIGNDVVLANAVDMAGHVEIGDFAIIGGMVGIHQYTRIGAHAFVQARIFLRKDVPPYAKAGREPVSYAGTNTIGLLRRGFSWEKIHEIQEIYRMIFLSSLNISQATEAAEAQLPATPELEEILTFIRSSQRGIIKKYRTLK